MTGPGPLDRRMSELRCLGRVGQGAGGMDHMD